jgi:hypothetical protein
VEESVETWEEDQLRTLGEAEMAEVAECCIDVDLEDLGSSRRWTSCDCLRAESGVEGGMMPEGAVVGREVVVRVDWG